MPTWLVPVDADRCVGLGLSGPLESKTPATMLAENRRPGSRSAPTPDGDASPPPNAGPRVTAATATPSRRAGARHWRNLRLRQTVVVAARGASQVLLSCENWWHGCPLRRVAQTSGSRSRDRHGVIGQMANRSATELPAIATSPVASAGVPQTQHRSGRRVGAGRRVAFFRSERWGRQRRRTGFGSESTVRSGCRQTFCTTSPE
jgi:hypothetical protein